MKTYVFLAEGFEEIEAVSIIDVLRRGGVETVTVSIMESQVVTGAHDITVAADALFADVDFSDGSMLVLPGGGPGTARLDAHEGLKNLLLRYAAEGKRIAAICAAPQVLGNLGLLKGRKATVYPGCEAALKDAKITKSKVVTDGNITTGRGPGFASDFALTLVALLKDPETADEVAEGMLLE